MTLLTLISRTLRFHWRAHIGVVLGAAISTAALTGALVIGDSVRGSLREKALERLGTIQFAMAPEGRYFRAALAEDLARVNSKPGASNLTVAAALLLPATASTPSGTARANKVNLLGVTPAFDRLAQDKTHAYADIPADGVLINPALAAQLSARPGDTIILRVARPSALAKEAPIAPRSDASVALRLRVSGIAPASALGNFSLVAQQGEPLNAFVSLEFVAERTGSAPLRLTPPIRNELTGHSRAPVEESRAPLANVLLATAAVKDVDTVWQLADLQAQVRFVPQTRQLEVTSQRVFIDPQIAAAALNGSTNQPGQLGRGQGILTYLANLMRSGTNATPYSLVSAAGPPYVPEDMPADGIAVNQWLGDDLHVKPGDEIELRYFRPESAAQLTEQTGRFRVQRVLSMSLPWLDRTLMPEFPGIEKAESTHDWDAGFPLTNTIRPKDEDYWKQHRGTPKAFISLAAGQRMWANRFGDLTSIRFSVPENPPVSIEKLEAELAKRILSGVKPSQAGMDFVPVLAQALAGASQAQDFGQLFLGFSFFVIAAALLLMALLFQFGLESRASETGTLLALGLKPGTVRKLLLGEGAGLALIGSALGAAGGVGYAMALVWGLTHVWSTATGHTALALHVRPSTVLMGAGCGLVVALITIWLALRRQGRRPARELLVQKGEMRPSKSRSWPRWAALVSAAAALAIVGWMYATGDRENAGAFFGAGALLLLAGLLMGWTSLLRAGGHSAQTFDLQSLAIAGCARRPWRSVATVALLASGAFMIAATSAFRLEANRGRNNPGSGTGGFAQVGECSLPVIADLNSRSGQEQFGLVPEELRGVKFVPFRVRQGDEASCLNLTRAQKPRVLGVDPAMVKGRFTFASVLSGARANGWDLLLATNKPRADEIPAIGDANSIQWALGKKLGDTLDYTDERGRTFKLRLVGALANSILQGNLVIAESEFLKRFPSESGYRMFLIDTPPGESNRIAPVLSRALEDQGLELLSATDRLNAFNAVQNTYLATFQLLGGLGLLLGSAGLGVIVLRNVLERRAELALLLALGFPRARVRRLVLSEHVLLLLAALVLGIISAAVAVFPALVARAPGLPYSSLALTLGAVLISGLFWTWLATSYALRGRLVAALRNE